MLAAVTQDVFGVFVGIGHGDRVVVAFAELCFFDDKAAADAVVGFGEQHGVIRLRRERHAVFVQRQEIAVEGHVRLEIKGDGFAARRLGLVQGEAAVCLDGSDGGLDVFDGNAVRQVAHQAEEDGDVGIVTAPGEGERAVNIGTDGGGAREQVLRQQFVDELPARFHRPDGVRAGRADADFVHVKDANHERNSLLFE